MTARGTLRRLGGVVVIATALLGMASPANADLLGGATQLLDETVDGGTDLIDGTVGSTGIDPVDGTVDVITDVADDTTGVLVDAVDDTTDAVTDTIAPADDEEEPVRDPSQTTVAPAPTPSRDGSTSTRSSAEVRGDELEDRQVLAESRTSRSEDRSTGSVSADPVRADLDSLRVLASATGAEHDSTVARIGDTGLYARLLGWLDTAGGLADYLASSLLGLEILLRALLSAGSGLVAPASLLLAFVAHVLSDGRRRTLSRA